MRRILLVIPVSTAVIAGLVAFKLTRHYELPAGEDFTIVVRPAPLLKLYDQKSEIVRLERYVGRSKLLIVFYDGSRGPESSPLLTTLRERYADLHATGAVVLAISAARPSENRYGKNLEHRKAAGQSASAAEEIRYPFPVLSDILYDWHRQYGAFDEKTGQPREAAFIVDRAGYIEYEHVGPDRLGRIDDWIRELREVR
ncbi:MAG: redoxin domain-containing protein [Deltaproteobacteria bacterium]